MRTAYEKLLKTPIDILILVFVLLTFYVITWAQRGMFFDGVTYAAVAHNLFLGIGNIRSPVFDIFPANSNSFDWHGGFYEHPSLVFVIDSLFYKTFGDAEYVDKLILITMCFCQLIVLCKIVDKLKLLFNHLLINKSYVVILWMLSNTIRFCMSTNFCDNYLTLFSMMGFYCFLSALLTKSKSATLTYYILGCVNVLLAVLSNGVTALAFLLTYPVLGFDKRNIIKQLFNIVLPFIVFFVLVLLCYYFFDSIAYNFIEYLKVQVLPSLTGGSRSMENAKVMPLYLRCWWYFYQIMLIDNPLFLILLLLFITGYKKIQVNFKILTMFLIVSLPIVIATPRSVGAVRFFEHAFFLLSILQVDMLSLMYINSSFKFRSGIITKSKVALITLSIISLLITIAILVTGFTTRDRNTIQNIDIIKEHKKIVEMPICTNDVRLVNDTNLQSYLIRYLSTNLSYSPNCDLAIYKILNSDVSDTKYDINKLSNNYYFYSRTN